jgi:hypothetical protein
MKTKVKTKDPKKTWGSFDREKGRKTALQALKALQRVRKQMASDASVSELSVNQMAYGLKSLEELIGSALPAPESVSLAKITGLFEGEE